MTIRPEVSFALGLALALVVGAVTLEASSRLGWRR